MSRYKHAIIDFLLHNDDKGSRKMWCGLHNSLGDDRVNISETRGEGPAANKGTKRLEDHLSPKNRCWKRARDLLLLYILASLSQFGVTEVSPSSSSSLSSCLYFRKTLVSRLRTIASAAINHFYFYPFFNHESRATCISPSCSSDFDRARKKRRSIWRSIFVTDKLRHWKPTFPTRFLAIAGIENREKCSWFISRK